VLAAAGAWGVSRAAGSAADPPGEPPAAAPSQVAQPQRVAGRMTSQARNALAEFTGTSPLVLVVLRGPDRLSCEDLGRQLRELEHRNRTTTFLIMTDSADGIGSFARRERLRWPVIALPPNDVVEGYPALPTPAVLAVEEGRMQVAGVAHPERVPNARVRSFADELADVLR
jgi:hypothetical protein